MEWFGLIVYYCIWTAGQGAVIIYSTTKDFEIQLIDMPKFFFMSLVSFLLAGFMYSNIFSG